MEAFTQDHLSHLTQFHGRFETAVREMLSQADRKNGVAAAIFDPIPALMDTRHLERIASVMEKREAVPTCEVESVLRDYLSNFNEITGIIKATRPMWEQDAFGGNMYNSVANAHRQVASQLYIWFEMDDVSQMPCVPASRPALVAVQQ